MMRPLNFVDATISSAPQSQSYSIGTNSLAGTVTSESENLSSIQMALASNPTHDAPTTGRMSLPNFRDPKLCMWTSSHAANCPSEDRSSSLVNVLLRPIVQGHDNSKCNESNYHILRLSLWSVIDGHGGGCVATYASEVLLPHVAANVARALHCEIVDRGVCIVNGELRDAYALDLDGLIRTSDRTRTNNNSVHYRSQCDIDPFTNSKIGDEQMEENITTTTDAISHPFASNLSSLPRNSSLESSLPQTTEDHLNQLTLFSSHKASAKTNSSYVHDDNEPGLHSPTEIAKITQAITESFLAVDEGWINSIDPVATHQTSCQSNGRWNAGACALVVFTLQRLERTTSTVQSIRLGRSDQSPRDDAPHNQDAARRRRLDYAAMHAENTDSVSSNSSILTDADPNILSAFESEITETEDDEEEYDISKPNRKLKVRQTPSRSTQQTPPVILTSTGLECHTFKAYDAMLYTAHVGDCRAVLLGSAPPRTIKVGPVDDACMDHPDTTDDESSHHSSDETECLSSSDHDAESSDDEDSAFERNTSAVGKAPAYLKYVRRPTRRSSRRLRNDMGNHAPFVALPPLPISPHSSSEESESDAETLAPSYHRVETDRSLDCGNDDDDSNESSLICGRNSSPPLLLAPNTRPIDLTTDHSAYNPAEVQAVLRRCNNAPRAISASVGGGIKRVAGSLAVTRALGDAYLKTPKLSFQPYANWCPYITAQPEVNFRLLSKDCDRVLIIATDGVWERCTGDDILRWVRNHSAEQIARAERKSNRNAASQAERMSVNEEGKTILNSLTTPNISLNITSTSDDEISTSNCGQKRVNLSPGKLVTKKRKVINRSNSDAALAGPGGVSTVADVIVRRVLNKVRRARNMSSLHALLSLPKGRARRSKHDDITASVVDLTAFVS